MKREDVERRRDVIRGAIRDTGFDMSRIEEQLGWLVCDGCGMKVNLEGHAWRDGTINVDDWQRVNDRDYCGTCIEQGRHGP